MASLMKKQRDKQTPSDIGVYYKMLQHFKQDNSNVSREDNGNGNQRPVSPNQINVKVENLRNDQNTSGSQNPQQESRGNQEQAQVQTPLNFEVLKRINSFNLFALNK
jgi:hypothetical protein